MPEIEQSPQPRHQNNNDNNNNVLPADNAALFGKYEVGKLLGCGAFAKVYHARNIRTGQSVAIKIINKKKIMASNSNLANNVKREISIMKRLRHPNIVKLHEVSASRSKIYFVMEFVKGGELFAKVAKGRFSEDLSRKYFRQLISAVGYCHSRGVFHRDLKPENLLVDEHGHLKVSDFGLSAIAVDQVRADGLLHTLCGTPAYVAPEILAKRGYDGAKVDVWSCGVILFVLTAGYLPFNDPNLMAMYKKIYKGEYRCPKWMSPDLKKFLSRLLDTNPETRITIDEILRDPWFSKGGYDEGTMNFYYDDLEKLDEEDDDDDEDDKDKTSLNAFDIISFSSGLDLSGLFDLSYNSVEEGQRFLTKEAPEEIVAKVEELAKVENLRTKKSNKKQGLHIQGQNGNLAIGIEFHRLTDGLAVVEVKRKGGDAGPYQDVWRNKLKPLLTGSTADSEASTSSSSSFSSQQ